MLPIPLVERFSPRLAAVLWTLAIAIGCALPGDSLAVSALLAEDKLLHLLAFAGFVVLWLRAGAPAVRVALWALAFGLAIETFQHVAPIGRRFDGLDLLANAVGLVVGLGLWMGWRAVRARPVPA